MYRSFVGLEVHVQLKTATKAFCSCRAAYGEAPNSNVCPVCLGYPGTLPVLNAEALRLAALTARALGCSLADRTWFERKQYFYPDMPKNYQISQFASPLAAGGLVELSTPAGTRRVRIKECHLEEDAGKMIHAGSSSFLDYNRAGTPLLEIVTEPDLEVGEEAEAFVRYLRRLVRYLGVSDGNMEEGSLRCDANVSVNLEGAGLGRKVEVKNLNSSRFVRLALDHEIERQTAVLEKGGRVEQETRLWNENRDRTEPMRSKESASDYRYFPEPDLPAFVPDAAFRAEVEAALVELPAAREARIAAEYGVGAEAAAAVCDERALADYFEEACRAAAPAVGGLVPAASRVAAWLLSDVKRIMNRDGIAASGAASLKLTPARLASLVSLVGQGRLSGKNAKQVLEAVFAEDADPEAVVRARGWEQLRDPEAVAAAGDAVLAREPGAFAAAAAAAASGDAARARTLAAYLVGKILASTDGRAEPGLVRELVERRIAGEERDALVG